MKNEAFEELLTSVRQAGRIRRGRLKPSRVTAFRPADVRAVRARLRTSQTEFALMIGVSVGRSGTGSKAAERRTDPHWRCSAWPPGIRRQSSKRYTLSLDEGRPRSHRRLVCRSSERAAPRVRRPQSRNDGSYQRRSVLAFSGWPTHQRKAARARQYSARLLSDFCRRLVSGDRSTYAPLRCRHGGVLRPRSNLPQWRRSHR
jgi:hypothetical protein